MDLVTTVIRPSEVTSVKTEDFEMKYVHFGNMFGPKTVILPGLSIKPVTDSYIAIARQYTIFADNSDVYLFDRKETVEEGYDLDQMAEDTIKAMEALQLKDIYLMGVSQGGMLAQLIAIKRPDLVSKMVLCSTAARVPAVTEKRLAKWVKSAEEGDREKLVEAFAKDVYSTETVKAAEEVFRQMALSITSEELARFVIMAKATAGFDVRKELKSVTCPTLVIGSGKDRLFSRKLIEELAALLRGNLYIYENGSHAAYDEEKDYPERIYYFFKYGISDDTFWK